MRLSALTKSNRAPGGVDCKERRNLIFVSSSLLLWRLVIRRSKGLKSVDAVQDDKLFSLCNTEGFPEAVGTKMSILLEDTLLIK